MRRLALVAVAVMLMPVLGWALDTSHRAPTKPPSLAAPNTTGPTRQGGDTIADAITIPAIPFTTTGTTTGFTDDYDEACPYTDSTAPDVVYSLSPATEAHVDIDMLGSSYDTKIYLYDADLELVACNDDFYPDYVSKLENIMLDGDVAYFLVIDGYGAEHGEYVLTISEYEPCILDVPPGAVLEGEPPLHENYIDAYNSGCNGHDQGDPFQDLHGDADGNLVFCGKSGWYPFEGSSCRDTDWFFVRAVPGGTVRVTADAEFPIYLFEHAPQYCDHCAIYQNILVGECAPGTMVMDSEVHGVIWLIVVPTTFSGPQPVYEYDYVLTFTGLQPQSVATEVQDWSSIKALFR